MQVHRITVGESSKTNQTPVDTWSTDSVQLVDHRPASFATFVGQSGIKNKLTTAITSAKADGRALGHVLLMWPSGYGKTTLGQLAADAMGARCVVLTAYALTKPADLLSLLPTLKSGDILFLDEIHRIKPLMEEILYTAMEDRRIDMIMPDGTHVNIPLEEFTLIGATTQAHKLTAPLKNRFVYQFHMEPYTSDEVVAILAFHLQSLDVSVDDGVITLLAQHTDTVPRMIKNMAITVRDRLWADASTSRHMSTSQWDEFLRWADVRSHGMSSLHERYLEVLGQYDGRAVWLKTIAMSLDVEWSILETDIEPLLIKQWLIEKTSRGRRKL